MSGSESWRREARQFVWLSRDATRRLLNAALLARESDPMGFAIWMAALLATPPTLWSVHQLIGYTTLKYAPAHVFDRIVLGDRLFFVTYAMLASLLLASLLWEALFPDKAEQEIVGVLPVRPRTVAAARLAAAVRLATLFAIAVNAPAGVIYTFAGAAHPALRSMGRLLIGHLVATLLAALCVFLWVLAARGVVALTLGTRAGRPIPIALQLITIILLVEAFFFLPALLDASVQTMLHAHTARWLPPVWFAALFSWMGGDARASFISPAKLAVGLTVLGAAVVAPMYLLSGSWVARRVMESVEPRRASRFASLMRGIATLLVMRPPVRALFLFASVSLVRSRRHVLMLSAYVSLGLALIIFRLAVLGLHRPRSSGAPERLRYDSATLFNPEPTAAHLAVPLILMFFLVLGLRASFRVPTEPDANWSFRLSPPSARDCVHATGLTLFALGILPVALLTWLAAATLWTTAAAGSITLLTAASGLVLLESTLTNWVQVPFACEHAPNSDTVKWKWIACLCALIVFAFGLSPIEAQALSSSTATALYVAIAIVVCAIGRVRRARDLTRRSVAFDETSADRAVTLSLSEALH